MIETIGLSMVSSNTLGVKLGDGHGVLIMGRCNEIHMNMGAVQICFWCLCVDGNFVEGDHELERNVYGVQP